ncbi:14880_t:CDS:2, partial [Racocetra persica]
NTCEKDLLFYSYTTMISKINDDDSSKISAQSGHQISKNTL